MQVVAFWLPSLVYLVGAAAAPAFAARYRTQPGRAAPTLDELVRCGGVVARNQLVGLAVQAAGHVAFTRAVGAAPYAGPVSVARVARDVALCLPLCELFFYALHALLHRPALYRRIHRVHHTFTAPVALAAQYCHWLEYVLTWYVPVMLPPLLVRASVASVAVLVAVVAFESAALHSGFRVGRLAERHDRHHMSGVRGGYGTFEFLDWVFGTELRDVRTRTAGIDEKGEAEL